MSYEPQRGTKVTQALEQRDWRVLQSLGVRWYDRYAERWFSITKDFWNHVDYLDITSE